MRISSMSVTGTFGACLLFSAGCASIISGSSDEIHVNSTPAGAQIYHGGLSKGTTPGTIQVKRGSSDPVVLKLDGYSDQSVPLGKSFNTVTLGNILLGGLIGIIVDFATGAVYDVSPDSVNVTMVPIGRVGLEDPDTVVSLEERLSILERMRASGALTDAQHSEAVELVRASME